MTQNPLKLTSGRGGDTAVELVNEIWREKESDSSFRTKRKKESVHSESTCT